MSRVFSFIKRRPKKNAAVLRTRGNVDTIVRFKNTTTNDTDWLCSNTADIEAIAERLALLENANEHTEYRKLQARYNIPNSEILKAYHRLGIA